MTAKKISELSAKTPVSTDLIPVADPTTGIAGKSTNSQFYNATIRSLSVAYTGNAPPDFTGIISPACAVQAGSSLSFSDGVTIESLNYAIYAYKSPTTLTFSNLSNARVAMTFSSNNGWTLLTALSFPALTAIGNNLSISVNSLTSLSAPILSYIGGTLTVSASGGSGPPLTTLSLPSLFYIGNAFISNFLTSLTTLSLPSLVYINGNFTLNGNSLSPLATLSFPALSYIGGTFAPTMNPSVTTISMPALTHIFSSFSPSNMPLVTTFSFPALEFVGGTMNFNAMAALTTVTFPALKSVGVAFDRTLFAQGAIRPLTMASLTSLTFPVIEMIGSNAGNSIDIFSAMAALSTFTLGSTLRRVEANVIMTSCALTQASVDGLLVSLAALNGTGLTTTYSSKTVTITGTSATPSATGLAAKATLVSRGCTVTHN